MIDSIIVSYSYNDKTNNALMCVGKKRPNETIEVINAFQGEEATRIWKELTTKKERTTNEKESS